MYLSELFPPWITENHTYSSNGSALTQCSQRTIYRYTLKQISWCYAYCSVTCIFPLNNASRSKMNFKKKYYLRRLMKWTQHLDSPHYRGTCRAGSDWCGWSAHLDWWDFPSSLATEPPSLAESSNDSTQDACSSFLVKFLTAHANSTIRSTGIVKSMFTSWPFTSCVSLVTFASLSLLLRFFHRQNEAESPSSARLWGIWGRIKKDKCREFPGSSVVRIAPFHCHRPGLIPWWGN